MFFPSLSSATSRIFMNITLRQLTVFAAAARHLNYTRAAEELFLTQPAVSMQIKQLEEQLGQPLFDHVGKKIYLTEAGRELQGALPGLPARSAGNESAENGHDGIILWS